MADWACPASARRRPSDGWALQEALDARPPRSPEEAWTDQWCKSRRNRNSLLLAGAGSAPIVAWGVSFWHCGGWGYGNRKVGWFGRSTKYGGADKLGHFSAPSFSTALTSYVHRLWGFPRKEAALRGALTSLLWWMVIELGAGATPTHRFSLEDMAADIARAAAGHLHETSPWVHRTLDWRVEYVPSERGLSQGEDPLSDYWGTTYLLAINAGALIGREPSAWDFLDFQIAYRTRAYQYPDEVDRRWVFFGVGLNVANLMRACNVPGATVFDCYQLPYVFIRFEVDLNEGDTEFPWGP